MMNDATTTEAMVNVVKMVKGSSEAYLRITKHADGRVTSELSMSIVWKPIGGRRAAFSRQARLEAEGYRVVAAA